MGRAIGLVVASLVLLAAIATSIAVGSLDIPLGDVPRLVFDPDDSDPARVVQDSRIPRTAVGLLVGAALGVAGALVQALTRNPLGDPGILGINAGAAAGVVVAIALFGAGGASAWVWPALAGAAIAAVVVDLLGRGPRGEHDPVRLVLAGVAVTFVLIAAVHAIAVLDASVLGEYRVWQVGELAGRPLSSTLTLAPFVMAGLVLAGLAAPALNVLALGDDTGRGLGADPARTRAMVAVAVVLLCGAATAAAGPIGFVGLVVPHAARAVVGADQRWMVAYCAVLAPAFVLAADVLGRVVDRPDEIEVAVVTAIVGAPVLVAIARRRRLVLT